ncbi:MAG: NTP transferase domain-containing protein [Clostridia bacterium]
MKSVTAIIIATGNETAMKSSRPKAMHELCGRSMMEWVLDAVRLHTSAIPTVITSGDMAVCLGENANCIAGSADTCEMDAMAAAATLCAPDGLILMLSAAMPLITEKTVGSLVAAVGECAAARLVCASGNEKGSIRSFAACCIDAVQLKDMLLGGEEKIDELVENIRASGKRVVDVYASEAECIEVQDRNTLWECERIMRSRINAQHMKNGVTMIDPTSTYISAYSEIGQDSVLYPGVMLLGKTKLGERCTIYGDSRLTDTHIGNDCVLQNVVANKADVGDRVTIGPFVNLRPDTHIADDCKIGDFVEVKNSSVGERTKLPHLSYIGDADIGKRVNVGCGCVFVNYDGFTKHRTIVGDDVFLGCQTNLVAPITIGSDVYTAAGSTITQNVPDGAMAIARTRQVTKPDWVAKFRALRQKNTEKRT